MADPAQHAAEEMASLLSRAERLGLSDVSSLRIAGQPLTPETIVEVLTPFMTTTRLARIDEVLAGRTYTVVPVVEGLVNTGNVSAVMRTAEALGYLGFHIVTHDATYKTSERTTQGAEKWLDVHVWNTPEACVEHLKENGYRVVATHLDGAAVPIDTIDFTEKTALVFGNERDGVTPEMLALADRRCIVPMTGFTRSFNISVAAAVCLYHAYQDRLARQGTHGDLSDEQRQTLRAFYCLQSVNKARYILSRAVREGRV